MKRKQTTHRRHGDSKTSKSRTSPDDEAPTTISVPANERSPNIDALRKARIAHITQSPEGIPREMKYEYEKRTGTVSRVEGEKETRRKTDKERTSEHKDTRPSTKNARRTERKRTERQDESEEEYEYVYTKPEKHKTSRETTSKTTTQPRSRTSVTASIAKKPETRRAPERRHTEPPHPSASRRLERDQ